MIEAADMRQQGSRGLNEAVARQDGCGDEVETEVGHDPVVQAGRGCYRSSSQNARACRRLKMTLEQADVEVDWVSCLLLTLWLL